MDLGSRPMYCYTLDLGKLPSVRSEARGARRSAYDAKIHDNLAIFLPYR